MKKNTNARTLLLTCCAVGALMAAHPSWAAFTIDNSAQVTTTTEGDVDSTPGDKADSAAIKTAVTAKTNQDDEASVPLTVEQVYDLGDAPDAYKTLAGSGGPVHEIMPGLRLGATVDQEADGQPGVNADGDGVDEDGVNITPLMDGQALTLSVTATNTTAVPANVVCWIDYNGDKLFATNGTESGGVVVPAGTTNGVLSVVMPQVPAAATANTGGTSYARCRLTTSTLTAAQSAGVMADGEVEDYKVTFAEQPTFDLALRKTLDVGQATNVQVGGTVKYAIEVINQGGVNATQIAVTDYIPAGMQLDDANWIDNGAGSATLKTPIAALAAGGTTKVYITLRVSTGATAGIKENAAEILSAKDGAGVAVTDVDSVMDNNKANEKGIVDNVVDNSNGDEDDHDIAQITVTPTVDIELTKTSDKTTARRGDTIVYTLTVINKGPDAATGIAVTDQLPAGLKYVSDNSAGSYVPATGVWTIGSLANDATKTITITTTVK